MTSKWIELSPEEAERNDLYGVGGWLVVFMVGILLGLLRNIGVLAVVISPSELLAIEHRVMMKFIIIAYSTHVLSVVIILWLLFSKKTYFRVTATSVLLSVWPVTTIIGATSSSPEVREVVGYENGFLSELLIWAITCAVWVPYLQRSKRVRVTYEHCVSENKEE